MLHGTRRLATLIAFACIAGTLVMAVPASATVVNPKNTYYAGDIACDPSSSTPGTVDPAWNNGAGDSTSCRAMDVANWIRGVANKYLVFALGDLQYDVGDNTDYQNSYDKTWGDNTAGLPSGPAYSGTPFLDITVPMVGNHEFDDQDTSPAGGAAGYQDYWGAAANWDTITNNNYCDPTDFPDGCGFYSTTIGNEWLVLVLNTDCNGPTSPPIEGLGRQGCQDEAKWIENTINNQAPTDNTGRACIMAVGHHPRYTLFPARSKVVDEGMVDKAGVDADGAGTDYTTADEDGLFQNLFDGRTDLYITGHEHGYARWPRMNNSGDSASSTGARQITVGTGGKDIDNGPGGTGMPTLTTCLATGSATGCGDDAPQFIMQAASSSAWNSGFNQTGFGALKLRLGDSSYDGEFKSSINGSVIDTVPETSCH